MTPARPRRLLLVGLMGSGKSSVGVAVAERTGWSLLDNDVLLRAEAGGDAAELEREQGVEALHRAEARVVDLILSAPEPCVATLPASAADDRDLPERLRRAGVVVWLRATPSTLARRTTTGPRRPLLPLDPGARAELLAAQVRARADVLAAAADVVLDVEGRDPGELAAAALAAMAG
ncbi:MAG: shikimate kinase [Candidatus Nanopelagicales bacterium]